MKMIHMPCPGHPDATLEGYILDCELSLGQEKTRPAILVCPGGGYVFISEREAEPLALSYAAQGYHAFVLRYSTGREAKGFAPLEEVSWAVGYIREHAAEWNIDPEKILSCGFSAGGHLALAAGVMAENKVNGMILGYPAASVADGFGGEFIMKLLTGKNAVTEEDAEYFNLVSKIDKNAPPVFLFATAEDLLTPYGALAVANKYSALGMGYEMHIFQHGPHGYSLATEVAADGSSKMLNAAVSHWHALSIEWMKKVYGKPEFVEKSSTKMIECMVELGFDLSSLK